MSGKTEELISVIVPVYNAADTLDACVGSILKQTWRNLELLLVDDASTDGSLPLCRRWEAEDRRVQVLQLDKNSGVSVARNLGIRRANGSWIAFVDSDDRLAEDYLRALHESGTGEEDILCCGCTVDMDGRMEENHFLSGDQVLRGRERYVLFRELLHTEVLAPLCEYIDIGVPWAKLYRTAFLRENGLQFDPNLRRHQDNVFNIYAFHAAKSIRYLDAPLYVYCIGHYYRVVPVRPIGVVEAFANAVDEALRSLNLEDYEHLAEDAEWYFYRRFVEIYRSAAKLPYREYLEVMHRLQARQQYGFLFRRGKKAAEACYSRKDRLRQRMIRRHLYGPLYLYRQFGKTEAET